MTKQRTNWVDLSDEEIDKIIGDNITITDDRLADGVYGAVLDIMRALQEKNGG